MEDKEDDEISIDFGKIKNIFKGKKDEKAEEKKDENRPSDAEKIPAKIKDAEVTKEIKDDEESDEDISIDFGKIKNIFKGKKEDNQVEAKIEENRQEEKKHILKEDDEDEIAIDFGKIKNLFKRQEKKHEIKSRVNINLNENRAESDDDEEISFDFGKVKEFFKGIGRSFKEEGSQRKSEDDVSFDMGSSVKFFQSNKKIIVPIVLILIAMGFAIYLRMQPMYLPITDNWAQDSVYNSIKSQMRSQIDQQYPNLPDANKNSLVESQFSKVLKEQGSQIDQQIKATSEYFKTRFQTEKGDTLMPDIDPYYWMLYAHNIIEKGHPGDVIVDGVQYDMHMLAPTGRSAEVSLHPYVLAYFYKFMTIFNKDADLITTSYYVPVIISALAIIPAFLIARRIKGNFSGFIAAFIVAIHPAFLTRTAGVADTDCYNVFFPLVITWLFLEAFEADSIRKRIAFSVSAGLFVGIYSFTWLGWWYIFDFIIVASAIYMAYYALLHRDELRRGLSHFVKKEEIKNPATVIAAFILASALSTTLTSGFTAFEGSLTEPMNFVRLKEVGITTVWPNVYTTVAEQNPASLDNVINQMGFGNRLLFLIGISGLLFSLVSKKNNRIWFLIASLIWYVVIIGAKPQNLEIFIVLIIIPIIIRLALAIKDKEYGLDVKDAILLILWVPATIYASVKGVRFMLLLVPAFSISFGVAVGFIYTRLNKWISEGFHINKYISKTAVILVLIMLLIGPYRSAVATAKNEIPLINDAWYKALTKINREAAPDAIVNSWWDFGHWFKYFTDRAVTFDGTTQSTPQAHWIGLSLLTDNEDLAVGILRMLDCSGYEQGSYAFDAVENVTKDTPRAVDIMYEILPLNKEDARKALKKHSFNDADINKVLQNSHCNPPEDYFITSDDMIGKSGVWAHFGSWDFNRALIYNTLNKEDYKNNLQNSVSFLQKRFNYTKEEAENRYNEVRAITTSEEANSWIAPWPSYASGLNGCAVNSNITQCGNGLFVNLSNHDAWLPTQQGNMHPKALVYLDEKGIIKKEFNDSSIPYAAALIVEGDSYKSILMAPELAASMYTRLFFMDGHGLKHFKLFSYEKAVTGGEVYVWKVDWDGIEPNVMDEFKKEEINQTAEEIASEEETANEVIAVEKEKGFVNFTKEANKTKNNNSVSSNESD